MTLIELGSAQDVVDLLRPPNKNVCITFSAHWCGPCKRSKPQLEQLAVKMHNNTSIDLKMAIVYESDLGNDIYAVYSVKAFPTYILFVNGQECQRVEGADLAKVQTMLESHDLRNSFASPGETLGGANATAGSAAAALTPAAARAQRLAKLDKKTPTTMAASTTAAAAAAAPTPMEEDSKETVTTTAARTPVKEPEAPTPMEEDKKEPPKKEAESSDNMDVEPTNETAVATTCTIAEESPVEMVDPTIDLNPENLKTLTESMGFSLLRAQKGLLHGNGNTVEGAVEWLLQHQDDDDIDEPIPLQPKNAVVAQSYKCNTCGKILSNMANLELHANKTGHADFEESTQHITPLSAQEKAEKLEHLKELLKIKRAEREEAEKVDDVEREKQRRNMGKEILKTKEQLDMEQRKREAALRKREKEAFKRERERLRAELAKDKAERIANAGKLSSRIGVDGYNPDGIQYDVPAHLAEGAGGAGSGIAASGSGTAASGSGAAVADNVAEQSSSTNNNTNKRAKTADASKIDDYIKKVASYRAGGDGGTCLKTLKIYIANVVDNPTEEKFKTINMENKAFKAKVKPFVGAKSLLMAVGFQPAEKNPTSLVLQVDLNDTEDDAQKQLLVSTKKKLEDAIIAYG